MPTSFAACVMDRKSGAIKLFTLYAQNILTLYFNSSMVNILRQQVKRKGKCRGKKKNKTNPRISSMDEHEAALLLSEMPRFLPLWWQRDYGLRPLACRH